MITAHSHRIIAHRGASADAPENTVASIQKALKLNVDFIEIDTRLSQEGVPVIFHDSSIGRITGMKPARSIHELSLKEIKQIDAGKKFSEAYQGEKIPSLLEVLKLDWKKTGLMLEIKKCPQSAAQVVKAVFEVLASVEKHPSSIIIGSFSTEIFDEVQRLIPSLKAPVHLIGIVEKSEMVVPFLDRGANHLAIWYKLLTPELIHFLKSRRVDMWTFTIDDVKAAKSLIALGVSGIITNHPARMQNL